jgi:UTP--glucose-1-phosphate uridylyltransferase
MVKRQLGGSRWPAEASSHHGRGAGGEIQLTDAMIGLAKTQKFYGVEFEGERHDCGSKAGFLRANIAYGMARDDLRDGLRAEMARYLKD